MLVSRVWPSRPTFESPFSDFDQLRRQLLRLFDTVNDESYRDLGAGVFPPINITQDDDAFYLRAEVPGVDKKNLEISALGRRVSISGKREIPKENDKASYHRKERAEGEFNRSITLPSEIDASKVDARYHAGVLTLTLPKAEAAKPRQIAVKS